MKKKSLMVVFALSAVVCLTIQSQADRAVSIKGEKKRMDYCFDVAFDETRNKLYVAAGYSGMHIFDAREGELQFVTTMRDEGYHRNLKIAGDRLFLADFLRGLVIYDISGKVPIETWRGEGVGMGIHVEGRYAYLAWQKRGLAIFDISDPDSPKMVGQCGALDNAWDVWVNDRYAYVADIHKGVATIDVSDPANPKKIRMTTWDEERPMAEIIRGEGNALFVGAGKHGMVVLDLIDPTFPRVSTIFHPSDGSYGEGLCVRDGLVYYANGHFGYRHENGLIVVDARKLDSVRELGRYSFLGWVEGVCVSGGHAFVANTGSGVRSVNITDPTRPYLRDSFGPIKDPYYDSHIETSIGEAEKSQLEKFATSKKEILEGKEFRDRSTPLRSLLTVIWALKSNDFNLYSQVYPSDAAYIIPKELYNVSKEPLEKWETAEVVRISPPDPQADEAALCAIYVRRSKESLPLQWDAHVFERKDGTWKKLYDMETQGPVWRKELSRANAKKDQPTIEDGNMTGAEKAAINEFRRIKARIEKGEIFEDTSTPLHAALSFLSRERSDTRKYFIRLNVLRAPLPPDQPKERTLWPVYMRNPGRTDLADTFVLVYSKGKWIWDDNMGSDRDWQAAERLFELRASKKIEAD